MAQMPGYPISNFRAQKFLLQEETAQSKRQCSSQSEAIYSYVRLMVKLDKCQQKRGVGTPPRTISVEFLKL